MFIKTSIAALSLIAIAGTAQAGEFVSNGQTTEVRHGDLNLNSAAGQKELNRRIRAAAGRVCQSGNEEERAKCRELAIAHVRGPVDAAIAKAETGDRFADASADPKVRVVVGN